MQATTTTLSMRTRGENHILDLTEELQRAVASSGVATGQLVAMVVGSTAAISTLEYEPGLVNHDIADALERVAAHDEIYVHEQTWHDDNGHSHVRAFIVGPSVALPIVNGKLPLGTWQQVVLMELDTKGRSREVVVSIVGE